ncbi:MAG: DNA alkylation repair protein [Phycisphaeraceae bacterium]|nr:DNA alkylation repair protein [Phycisphaeraceae bacterium]MCW5755069.1 DNA alkylation repair protein [Phycisphaeraceae bacterium]
MPKAKIAAKKPSRGSLPRMSLQEVMNALELAGSAQTRKTYARHGASEPMFGVSFAALKSLRKRIGIDQALAQALWETGNFDARNLAVKIADPAGISSQELDRWAATPAARMCGGYVGHLAAESPHGRGKADQWLAASDDFTRFAGWSLVAAMAMIDETMADSWFAERLKQIEGTIHTAPNSHRWMMNQAIISIGCRNDALRQAAVAAARRIGVVEVDYGDTDCKTPDAVHSIEKAWAHSTSKGFASPAAHERSRESMRTRC